MLSSTRDVAVEYNAENLSSLTDQRANQVLFEFRHCERFPNAGPAPV